MGGTISSFIDHSASDKEAAKDAMNSLKKLADTKKDKFDLGLYELAQNLQEIPIDKKVEAYSLNQISVEKNMDKVGEGINNALGSFVHGNFLSGFETLITNGLKLLFSNYSENESELRRFLIFVGKHGGIHRLDYELYSYRFESDSLTKYTETVTLVTFVHSSVDPKKLDVGTVRVLLENMYNDLPDDKFQELEDMIIKEIQ